MRRHDEDFHSVLLREEYRLAAEILLQLFARCGILRCANPLNGEKGNVYPSPFRRHDAPHIAGKTGESTMVRVLAEGPA